MPYVRNGDGGQPMNECQIINTTLFF